VSSWKSAFSERPKARRAELWRTHWSSAWALIRRLPVKGDPQVLLVCITSQIQLGDRAPGTNSAYLVHSLSPSSANDMPSLVIRNHIINVILVCWAIDGPGGWSASRTQYHSRGTSVDVSCSQLASRVAPATWWLRANTPLCAHRTYHHYVRHRQQGPRIPCPGTCGRLLLHRGRDTRAANPAARLVCMYLSHKLAQVLGILEPHLAALFHARNVYRNRPVPAAGLGCGIRLRLRR